MTDRSLVVIAGAGPAGLLTAARLRHVDALVLEASGRPGWPPHCTGLVSPSTAERFGAPEAVTESYREAVFLDDGLREVCRVEGSPLAVRFSRPLLEEVLASRVEALGHRIAYHSRVVGVGPNGCARLAGGGRVCGGWVVAAVGAKPGFSRLFGAGRCGYIPGFEVRARLALRLGEDAFYTVHGRRTAPKFFAWVVPVAGGREAVIGVADERPVERLQALLPRLARIGVQASSIISHRAGRIVLGPPAETPLAGRAAGIGDVLCASKPFTGGGLYAVSLLAEPLAEALEGRGAGRLLAEWARLRRELEAQRILTRAARVLQPLWRMALATACHAAARGRCSIDYDVHTSLARCLAPWGRSGG
ncbi:hypothetical protein CF15_03195 [Pyrodictium occultum]|uniref:FAD-binding domain-containing protein n=1 Tax=Pyrodictium occultum TaxID=2309 RepID=A0A0V8RUW9_PYROC|nr:NAD(P)/FAD-dependent oxidoreductase [Pyrodictium occultum]KSW11821.1 hypothetical protein CF15_03195 [Pyrodictium occultum]